MLANPYIRKQRRLFIGCAVIVVFTHCADLSASALFARYAPPDLLRSLSIINWILYGAMVVTIICFCVTRSRKLSRARTWLAQGRCPSCGYDRKGLLPDRPCPECAAANAIVVASPAPPRGTPVCVRCGGDMSGRENRTCPTCGAMYGIDYFEE